MKTMTVEKGQALDKVVRDHYGTPDGPLEAVLAANPGLAAMGPIFDRRRTIALPEVAPAALGARQTKLYD